MKSVAILLSTYNGEKYLREQLDTLLCQTGVEIQIFVRDDGSSDATKSILVECAEKHSNIHLTFSVNVGVGNSFMNLLYSVPDKFDYYAFADQDDIWEDNKIIEAIRMIDESGALLYASNQECVDKYGNSMGLRYKFDDIIHLTPISILQKNIISGCTMVFTLKLYKILTAEENRPSVELLYNRIHDVWVAFVASLHGGIIYDTRSFIKYRQHENNVVGVKRHRGEKLKKLKNKKLRNGRSMLAREGYNKFSELAAQYPLLELSAKSKTFKGKNGLIKNKNIICKYSGESRLGFIIKVLCCLY